MLETVFGLDRKFLAKRDKEFKHFYILSNIYEHTKNLAWARPHSYKNEINNKNKWHCDCWPQIPYTRMVTLNTKLLLILQPFIRLRLIWNALKRLSNKTIIIIGFWWKIFIFRVKKQNLRLHEIIHFFYIIFKYILFFIKNNQYIIN